MIYTDSIAKVFKRVNKDLILISEKIPGPWRSMLRKRLYRATVKHTSFMEIRDKEQYQLLREHGDIHRLDKDGVWLVTGFELADLIVRDTRGFVKVRQTEKLDKYNMFQLAAPDAHERMQHFLMSAFTKKMLADDAEFISDLSLSMFDAIPHDIPIDLHRRFCIQISYRSVCRILGIHDDVAKEAYNSFVPTCLDLTFPDHFEGWLRALLLEPRSGDDGRLINLLRQTILDGVYTPDQAFELLNIVWNGFLGTMPILLSLAFEHVTTPYLIAIDEDLADGSWALRLTDEVVRMRPVILKIIRKATRDAELGGVKIKEGDRLLIDLKTVNRDGRQFSMPDTFSIDDNRQRHLSFGAGAHRCLGMQMARHSARYILTPLRERFRALTFIHSEWLDMETPLTFIHYPEKTSYRIRSVLK